MLIEGLQVRVTQEEFGAAVGIGQPRVAQLLADGVLQRDGTARQWLLAYCERLREQAAGRGQELTMERAALARSQRVGQDLKNAVAQGEFAPIGLLTDTLSAAAAAVAQRFDALEPELRRHCPELGEAQRAAVARVLAGARNEWVRATTDLITGAIDALPDDDEDDQLALDMPAESLPPAA